MHEAQTKGVLVIFSREKMDKDAEMETNKRWCLCSPCVVPRTREPSCSS